MNDFTVLSPAEEDRLNKLNVFYNTIRRIALEANLFKATPVYEALSEVDPKWNENSNIWNDIEGRN